MESDHRSFSTALGFCLLPSELIQYIILQLALPDIIHLKIVNKSIASILSDQDFVRDYNLHTSSANWLFIYKKRWHRDAILYGITDCCSTRWFKILIAEMLKSTVPPGEDLYFLTASGNFFLFALNTSREVISVNPVSRTVKKIPPSPLGPRGTSSWRRSGMKLLSYPPGSNEFRFIFAEVHQNRPTLFEYDSRVDTWHVKEATEEMLNSFCGLKRVNEYHFLSAYNGLEGSVIIAVRSPDEAPLVFRPRFPQGGEVGGQLGFDWGNLIDRLHVYGDGNMMIIRSNSVISVANKRLRVVKGVELLSMSSNGGQWNFISSVPSEIIDKIKKPYGAMMGCLQQRNGKVRGVLMSNMEGVWDIIWLCYDIGKENWTWLPLPEYCNMKSSNMAGIAFSSGLTLS
ncbi:hypothetical protein Leryth_020600 [Lithospermum erythrorhizon]|nr:hypothetical protein Leryth_020600 [Lithospermum erythrorhizon]